MKKIFLVAGREFVATVSTKAFIIGLLIMPMFIGVAAIVFPRLLNPRNFKTTGEVAIINPSGKAAADIRAAFAPERVAERREEQARQALNQAPEAVRQVVPATRSNQMAVVASAAAPDLRLIDRPAATDIQREKTWLLEPGEPKHLALIVIHENAVTAKDGVYGSYDAYVPASIDDRSMNEIHQALQEAIVNARAREQGVDRGKA
jgi:hypothetical protein